MASETQDSQGISEHGRQHSSVVIDSDASIHQLVLVNALASHSTQSVLSAILNMISATGTSSSSTSSIGSPLHLVVSLGSKQVIEAVLQTFCSPSSQLSVDWINTVDATEGETPLHIASKLGRLEPLELLMALPNVDDTIRNIHGRMASEVAKNENILLFLNQCRDEFVAKTWETIRTCILNQDYKAIVTVFESSRRAINYLKIGWIDINAPVESGSERSLLHLFSQADDLESIHWALSVGADPDVKDRKGKKPSDLTRKDKVKEKLKSAIAQTPILSASLAQAQAAAENNTSVPFTGPQEAPILKGTLFKWVNYTSGYKPRYFVLENGTFSYYHTIEDYPSQCRGSISTVAVKVSMPDSTDKTRFDVIGSGSVRYSLKARSPADAKKWVWAIMESKRFMTDSSKQGSTGIPTSSSVSSHLSYQLSGVSIGTSHASSHTGPASSVPIESPIFEDDLGLDDDSLMNDAEMAWGLKEDIFLDVDSQVKRDSIAPIASPVPASPQHVQQTTPRVDLQVSLPRIASQPSLAHKDVSGHLVVPSQELRTPSLTSPTPSASDDTKLSVPKRRHSRSLSATIHDALAHIAPHHHQRPPSASTIGQSSSSSNINPSPGVKALLLPAASRSSLVSNTSASSNSKEITTTLHTLETQLVIQQRVIESVLAALSASDLKTSVDIPKLLESSSGQIRDLVQKLVGFYQKRERALVKKVKQEIEARKRWEDVVQKVVSFEEQQASRQGLRSQAQPQVGDVKGTTSTTTGMGQVSAPSTTRPAQPTAFQSRSSLLSDDSEDIFYDAEEDDLDGDDDKSTNGHFENVFGFESIDTQDISRTVQEGSIAVANSIVSLSSLPRSPILALAESELDGNGLIFATERAILRALVGYTDYPLRSQLPLDPSKPKPALAVWSFLKSAIGKDLSKVTLPVFFNEPLSMLQRLCEDVEYSELLSLAGRVGRKASLRKETGLSLDAPRALTDVAAETADTLGLDVKHLEALEDEDASLLRIMLVAAFGMSSYSSTVGRTSKPFNPMLGETFELARPDKGFRYLSEQVCHHPPISTCFCDSVDYQYWAEVNVKSKFWGKSLEIHPLGLSHVRLPLYSDIKKGDKGESVVDMVGSEHYSWRKVTTVVNNLIMGTLSIDHSGDMTVKNWRTGEECTITFRKKESGGWFGGGSSSTSNEWSPDDPSTWTLSGNVKDKNGRVRYELRGRWDHSLEAVPVSLPSTEKASWQKKPFLIWKRHSLPHASPQNFQFTSFAMSLNQLDPSLRPKLPLTDSRLRPDQSAMEGGEWEDANSFKEKLETYQRTRRKQLVAEYEKTGIPSGPAVSYFDPASTHSTGKEVQATALEMGEQWWNPRWFVREIEPDTNEAHWRFVHHYWKTRDEHAWPDYVLDIFGVNDPSF